MNKRKLRFNFIDAVIILVVAAVIFAVLYVFVFSGREASSSQVNSKTIRYVIEVNDIDEYLEDIVKKGQPVEDAIKRKKIGTVAGVQAVPFEILNFDYENKREVTSTVEGRIVLKITVEAQAVETDSAFIVDGCEIRVGQQYSLIMPDFYGIGYCTELIRQ